MSKVKIMYFVAGVIGGGVEQVLYNYGRYLDKEKYEVFLVYQHEPIKEMIDRFNRLGWHTIRVTARTENPLISAYETWKVIKENKPDIVHANTNIVNFWSLLPAKILKIKGRISHSHIAEKDKSTFYKIIAYVCKRLTIKTANLYVACGKEAGEYMYGSKPFIIINNALDLSEFVYTKDNFRVKLNLEGKIIIGHAGRFTAQKNQKRVIEIFESYLKENSNAHLLLAGVGEDMETIRQYVSSKGLTKHVTFLGIVRNMQQFYSAIDVFILPSLYEGLPVVGLEVQAAGIPAILSDNIDKSVKITSLIDFMSLSESNEEWSKAIEKVRHRNKVNYKQQIREAGYDVSFEVKKLEKIYRNLSEG